MLINSKLSNRVVFKVFREIDLSLMKEIDVLTTKVCNLNAYQTSNWIIACSKNLSRSVEIKIIAGYLNNELVFILPIENLFKLSISIYGYINPIFSDYTQPLISNSLIPVGTAEYTDLIEESLSAIGSPCVLLLRNQYNVYHSNDNELGINQFKYTNSFIIDLDNINIKKSYKKKARYYQSRIKRTFKSYSIENYDSSDSNLVFPEFYIDEILRLKNEQLKRTLNNKRIESDIWKYISRLKDSELSLFISILKIGEELISGIICIKKNNVLYYIFPAYSIKYKKYSIGSYHLYSLLKSLNKEDIKYFDLTIGNENYKRNFANDLLPVFSSIYVNKKYLHILKIPLMIFYRTLHSNRFKPVFNLVKLLLK